MANVSDDRSEHCVPFILERIDEHRKHHENQGQKPPPFFIGINGVQGAGKTTLVENLHRTLTSPPHSLPTLVLSIDDLYLPHSRQEALASSHPSNPLVQHRGEPSTHDIELGKKLFRALAGRESGIKIPSYDKSAYNGAGDQKPESEWDVVNAGGQAPIEVVIFEGWCVGFRPLSDWEVEEKWNKAKWQYEREGEGYKGQLGKNRLDSVIFVNQSLRQYDELTDQFGAFIHIDAEDPLYVYDWRLEPERAMRESKGKGMSDEQVIKFVDGYFPAYELFTVVLRHGIFGKDKGKQLRLVVNKNRRVKEVYHL